jgi:hypothetical protein
MRVSAVWLWRGLEGQGATGRRTVDPVWACVALAAVLAALALAKPVWRAGQMGDAVQPEWAVRSIGGRTEAWARIAGGGELLVDGVRKQQAHLEQGAAIELPVGDEHVLSLERAGRVVARASFRRPAVGAFRLLQVGRVDPALQRVFALQSGSASAESPQVLLAGDPAFLMEDARGARLCVVEGPARLDGITIDGTLEVNFHPDPVDVPAFVNLEAVTVHRMVRATLSPDWHVTIRLNGLPWVAERTLGGTSFVWLASRPDGADTDWPNDRSFVLYFSDLLRRTIPSGAADTPLDWPRRDDPPPSPARQTPLTPALGIVCAALLALAMLLLWQRSR